MKTAEPQRMTTKAQAFEAGFRAKLDGKPKDSCPFASAELKDAWLRGFKKCDEMEKGKQ